MYKYNLSGMSNIYEQNHLPENKYKIYLIWMLPFAIFNYYTLIIIISS